jgi:hypothetical protein
LCWLGYSRCVSGVRGDNAAKLAVAPDRAVTGGPKIDLKHVVADAPPTMRALDIVVAHPSPQDVVELGTAEADEEIQAFAFDRADERFREGVCVGVRPPCDSRAVALARAAC